MAQELSTFFIEGLQRCKPVVVPGRSRAGVGAARLGVRGGAGRAALRRAGGRVRGGAEPQMVLLVEVEEAVRFSETGLVLLALQDPRVQHEHLRGLVQAVRQQLLDHELVKAQPQGAVLQLLQVLRLGGCNFAYEI